MIVNLHKKARTTPEIRREIQQSNLSERVLAKKYGVSRPTIRKWKSRDAVEDRSHRPHRLATTLSPAQEALVVELRTTLKLSVDDLLMVVREFIHSGVSRSGLDRCLRRHGVSNLAAMRSVENGPPAPRQTSKDDEPGSLYLDVKYLPQFSGESQQRSLLVAVDRATHWVYLELHLEPSAADATAFLDRLRATAPFIITRFLTDKGGDQPSGRHQFEQDSFPSHPPQTNSLVESFNGRIDEVLATTHFNPDEDLARTLERALRIYNHQLPQGALGRRTPMQSLRQWYKKRPGLFHTAVYDLSGDGDPDIPVSSLSK